MNIASINLSATSTAALESGSESAPSVSFSGDPTTGLYLVSAGNLALTTNGSQKLLLSNVAFTNTLPTFGPNGTASAPAYSFASDTDTGLFSGGSNILELATGGILRLSLSTTGITTTLPILANLGTDAAPAITFASDSNTGIYRPSTNVLGFTCGGSESLRLGTVSGTSAILLRFPDGTEVTSAISFSGNSNMGIFRSASNTMNLATNGVSRVALSVATLTSNVPYRSPLGSAGSVAYGFDGGFFNLGMFSSAANVLNFAAAGASRLQVSNTAITTTLPVIALDGTAGAPSYAFTGSTNTGLYRYSNGMGVSVAGTGLLNIETTQVVLGVPLFNSLNARLFYAYAGIGVANDTETELATASGTTTRNTGGFTINANDFTVPSTGTYVVYGAVNFDSNATGYRLIAFDIASTKQARNATNAISGVATQLSTSGMYDLTSGQTISLVVRQTSGGSLGVSACILRAMRIY